MTKILTLAEARKGPFWRRPEALLILVVMAMPVAFSTWSALLNNWVIDAAGFDGHDIGWLHTVREIPGFLAIGIILVLMLIREQVLMLIALLLLGVATAVTAWFPSMGGILMITMLSSIGFHYHSAVLQSLQLQWIDKARTPQVLGWLVAAGSAATLVSYGLIILTWQRFDLTYNIVFMLSGGVCALVALYALIAFPQFASPNPQKMTFVLRQRYWLYYAMEFLAGARRQIFTVFASFMMVEHFGFKVDQITTLFLITLVANLVLGPAMGKAVSLFGERATLTVEHVGLIAVFLCYSFIYHFGWGVAVAMVLYVLDNLLFTLAMSLKTYFQKIADPGDIAPTAAVSFTINHIAAVFLPAALGYLWLVSPAGVFYLASALAAASLVLARLIPRHPEAGYETVFARRRPAVAE